MLDVVTASVAVANSTFPATVVLADGTSVFMSLIVATGFDEDGLVAEDSAAFWLLVGRSGSTYAA